MFVAVAAIAWSEITRSMQKLQPVKLLAAVVVSSQNPPASAHRSEYGFEPETITWTTGSPSEKKMAPKVMSVRKTRKVCGVAKGPIVTIKAVPDPHPPGKENWNWI